MPLLYALVLLAGAAMVAFGLLGLHDTQYDHDFHGGRQ